MKTNNPENRNSLDAMLASLGKDELVGIIKELADFDEKIEAKLIARHSAGGLTRNDYKRIISSVLDMYRRRGGFIAYRAPF